MIQNQQQYTKLHNYGTTICIINCILVLIFEVFHIYFFLKNEVPQKKKKKKKIR